MHLESTNRRVDVIAEGFDIAIRVRFPPLERPISSCASSTRAGSALSRALSCCRPARLPIAGRPRLACPASISARPSATTSGAWNAMTGARRADRIVRASSPTTWRRCAAAAIAGVGVVQLPTLMIWDDIQAGQARECAAGLGAAPRHRACRVPLAARSLALRPRAARLPRRSMQGPAPGRRRGARRLNSAKPA